KAVMASADSLNNTYSNIIKGMQQRKLMEIKIKRERLKLEREESKFIEESNKRLCKAMEIKNLYELDVKTKSPLKTLKILLSLYRRVKILAKYQGEGKAN